MTFNPDLVVADVIVDARGWRCPIPTLRLRRAVERATPGAIVRLLTDDPVARIDVPHFAASAGLEILAIRTAGEATDILLRVSLERTRGAPLGGNGAPPGLSS